MRKTVVWSAVIGAAIGAVAWVYGVQGIRPGVIAVAVVGIAVVFRGFEDAAYRPWPSRPTHEIGGGTATVSRIATRLRRHTDLRRGPDPGMAHQIRRLTIVRLGRRGLSLTDPGAGALLGPGVRAALLDDDTVPSHATVTAVVDAIDRLGRVDQPPTESTPAQGASG